MHDCCADFSSREPRVNTIHRQMAKLAVLVPAGWYGSITENFRLPAVKRGEYIVGAYLDQSL